MHRVHTPPSRVSTGTHSTSSPLRTHNLGWSHMIYSWFLLLSPSLYQFIGASKEGFSAAAKQPGRCSFLKLIFIYLLSALQNSTGLFLFLMCRVWMWAETGSWSFSSFRWINSVPASSSRYGEIHPVPVTIFLKGQFGEKEKFSPALVELEAVHGTLEKALITIYSPQLSQDWWLLSWLAGRQEHSI